MLNFSLHTAGLSALNMHKMMHICIEYTFSSYSEIKEFVKTKTIQEIEISFTDNIDNFHKIIRKILLKKLKIA